LQDERIPKRLLPSVYYMGKRMQLSVFVDTSKLNMRSQKNGIAPNWVHSLDSAHLMSVLNVGLDNGLDTIACIHDSFGTHACDVDLLHAVIRETFIEQYGVDRLAELRDALVDQLTPEQAAELPPLPAHGNLELSDVKNSEYFFA